MSASIRVRWARRPSRLSSMRDNFSKRATGTGIFLPALSTKSMRSSIATATQAITTPSRAQSNSTAPCAMTIGRRCRSGSSPPFPISNFGYCFTTKTSKHRSIATMSLHDCVRAFPDTKRARTMPLQQQAPVCRSPWSEPQRLRKDSRRVTSRNLLPQSDYWSICLSI
ncbi:hypothetical protein OY671_007703 [Metschnikowia pulcherrima]|nr:hypothetical protein OY671_007703 [Metschnikowia pulcherrima]